MEPGVRPPRRADQRAGLRARGQEPRLRSGDEPTRARCTSQDIRGNIYGRDPKTGWARRPTDNVGIQYGLAALNSGAIGVDEFLEVNEKIGGTDIEGKVMPERAVGDPIALRAIYESGLQAS